MRRIGARRRRYDMPDIGVQWSHRTSAVADRAHGHGHGRLPRPRPGGRPPARIMTAGRHAPAAACGAARRPARRYGHDPPPGACRPAVCVGTGPASIASGGHRRVRAGPVSRRARVGAAGQGERMVPGGGHVARGQPAAAPSSGGHRMPPSASGVPTRGRRQACARRYAEVTPAQAYRLGGCPAPRPSPLTRLARRHPCGGASRNPARHV
jgi:hypothetical protein